MTIFVGYIPAAMTWKRIQTLFIALAAALVFAMLACNMCYARVETPDVPGTLMTDTVRFTENLTVTLVSALAIVVMVVALAVHRLPYVEGKVCLVALIILLFLQAILLYYFFRLKSVYTFTVAALFPAIAAILLGIARHYTGIDAARMMVDQAFAKRFPQKQFTDSQNK